MAVGDVDHADRRVRRAELAARPWLTGARALVCALALVAGVVAARAVLGDGDPNAVAVVWALIGVAVLLVWILMGTWEHEVRVELRLARQEQRRARGGTR